MTHRSKKTRNPSRMSTAFFCVLISSLFLFERHAFLAEASSSKKAIEEGVGTKGVGNSGIAHHQSNAEREASPRAPSSTKSEVEMSSLGGEEKIKDARSESKDVKIYASSNAKLSEATEMEFDEIDSTLTEEGKKKSADDAIHLASVLESSSSQKNSRDLDDLDWIFERYARANNLYAEKKKDAAKVAEKKLQEQLEKEEEETKRKFFVGKPKLVDGRSGHVSKSRSKGSFAFEHIKGRNSDVVVSAPATREKNEQGLHHHNHHQQKKRDSLSFIESVKGTHKDGGDALLETSLAGKERKELSKDYFDSATSPAGEVSKDLSKRGSHHRDEQQQQKELRVGSSIGRHKLEEEVTKRSRDRLVNETSTAPLGDNCHWFGIIPQGTCWICDKIKRCQDQKYWDPWMDDGPCSNDCGNGSKRQKRTGKQSECQRDHWWQEAYCNSGTKPIEEYRYVSCFVRHCPPPPSPPPPSPPPPLPPPPLPPPGETVNKPVVMIDDPLEKVSDREFDFRITVSDDGCSGESTFEESASDGSKKLCFATQESLTLNLGKGLYCNAYVGNDDCTYENATNTLPCMKWDNFFNPNKSRNLRKSLTLRDEYGQVAYTEKYGKYSIYYSCAWFYDAPHYTKEVPGTSHGNFVKLHEFEVKRGCSKWMEDPAADSKLIAQFFLLSSPDFVEAKECEYLDEVKEMIFRKFDVAPTDGVLTLDELLTAFRMHSVDTTYVERLIEMNYFFDSSKRGLLLNEVKQSQATPLACVDPQTDGTQMYYVNVTYPKRSATEQQCLDEKSKVEFAWDYVKVPAYNDKQCIYSDGIYFKQTIGTSTKRLTDYRPPSFVGPSRVKLVSQLTFDSENTKIPVGFSKVMGEPGGFVMETASSSKSFYTIEIDVPMEDSAIMMWVSMSDFMPDESFLWYAHATLGETKYTKYLKVTSNGKVLASFFQENYVVESKAPLEKATWTHVAMSVSKLHGFSIFINGDADDNVPIIDNTKMDFPAISPLHFVFTHTALHSKMDDFRMYTGLVTPLHVHATYKCGRTIECAERAFETPQSRRIYCVIPNYLDLGRNALLTPVCTTGLFYFGSPLDLEEFADRKGVMFQFRDTAVGEIGYEILSRRADGARTQDESQAVATSEYKSVVLIEANLDGCSSIFSSLTFFDDVAIREPGVMWEFAVQAKFTKTSKTASAVSDPSYYLVPWVGYLQGTVSTAQNARPVEHVRICARTNATVELALKRDHENFSDKAIFMPVMHSNRANVEKRSNAFRVTDGDFTTGVKIGFDEYLNITLSGFTFVKSVELCTQIPKIISHKDVDVIKKSMPEFDVRVLDYPYADDRGDKGSQCSAVSMENTAQTDIFSEQLETLCQTYACKGTDVMEFIGQYVTVRSLNEHSDEPTIVSVQAMGKAADCPYYAFSDETGNFEMDIIEPKGNLNKRHQIGVKAYKEEIFDSNEMFFLNATDEIKPESVLIALDVDVEKFRALREEVTKENTASPSRASTLGKNETESSASTVDSKSVDSDKSSDYAKIVDHARSRTRYTGVHFIIPQSFWDVADGDGDYKLNQLEWKIVEIGMQKGIVFGTPWFVFPTIKTKHLTGFRTVYSDENHKPAVIALVPADTPSIPFMEEEWQVWYQNASLVYPGMSVSVNTKTVVDKDSGLLSLGFPASVMLDANYVIPFATLTDGTHISFENIVPMESRIAVCEEEKGLVHRMFGASSIQLRAYERLKDIIHVFNEQGKEDVTVVTHLSSGEIKIQDKTTVPVSGFVRFAPNRTQGYICGLQFPIILAYEGQLCDFDELHECSPRGYKYEENPNTYEGDEMGYFEFQIPPGTTWAVVAKYDGHDICFGGDSIEAEACSMKNITDMAFHPTTNTAYDVQRSEIRMGEEDNYTTNAFFELVGVEGGEFMSFFDVTNRSVDIGLYAGACATEYENYSLMITPANGCGGAQVFSDEDLRSWQMVNLSDEESTHRIWPFAAMDYYIELYQTPDVSGLTESVLLQANAGAECTPPGTDIMQFFRDRNILVQMLKLLDRAEADAVYRYHGWLCANPTFGGSFYTSLSEPFTNIRADEVCLGNNASKNDLTLMHLIGVTNSEYSTLSPSDVSKDKFVSLQIVEAHWTHPQNETNPIFYCPKFTSTVNDVPTTLGLTVQIQQDVESVASNKCHPNNEVSPECVMNTLNEVGLVMFPPDGDEIRETHAFKISSTTALPNLVSPYRRQFIASIERYDGWAYTTLNVHRELVTLASKTRGGGDDPNARYQSDTKFYCTAPIRGLVFTVVHDPPGGYSFASVGQGTRIEVSTEMHTTRGARRSEFSDETHEKDVSYDFEIGPDAGSGYMNIAAGIGGTGFPSIHLRQHTITHTDYTGPEVSASATTDRGWDFHMILDRDLQSSADPGIPGRPGDTLLGGGFEIVYIRVDTVDIRQQEHNSSSSLETELDEESERDAPKCLKVLPEIQWLPRKPTSYVMEIYTIEYRILPELQGLIAECDNQNSIVTDAEMGNKPSKEIKEVWKARLTQSVDDWKRTIEWSSPDFNPEGLNALSKGEKKAKLDEIASRWDSTSAALNSIDGLMGKAMKPRIDDAYGMYTQNKELSNNTADIDWNDLSFVWDRINDENLPVKGIPPIRRQDEYNPYDGWTANRKAAGLDNSFMQNLLGLIAAITGVDIAQILLMQDSIKNPNPHGYMDSEALLNIVGGKDIPSEEYKGNDFMKEKYDQFINMADTVQRKIDQVKALINIIPGLNNLLPQLTNPSMSADETMELYESDSVQGVMLLIPEASASLGRGDIGEAELGFLQQITSFTNKAQDVASGNIGGLIEQLLTEYSDEIRQLLPVDIDLDAARQILASDIPIIVPILMDPSSVKPSDVHKLLETEIMRGFFRSDFFTSILPPGINVDAILDFIKSEDFKAIIPLIKDPMSIDLEDAKLIINLEPVQNFLKSDAITNLLPEGFTIDTINKLVHSDLFTIIEAIMKNPKDFDLDDAKAIINSQPVKDLIASQQFRDLIPDGIPIDMIEKIGKSEVVDILIPVFSEGKEFTAEDAHRIINSDLVQDVLHSDAVKGMLPEGINFTQVSEFMQSDLTKIIFPLLKDPKSFSADDMRMILNSDPIQKLIHSDEVQDLLPEGVDLAQIIDFLASDAFKILTDLIKGDKFTAEDAKEFINSEPVKKLLSSDFLAQSLPWNINLSAIPEMLDSDIANVVISLFKDPKSFGKDDVKIILDSEPMQAFLNSDMMTSILPAGLTFGEVREFFESESFEAIKSLFKDPSTFSAEDAKMILKSDLFQRILSSIDFKSMLPDGITMEDVKMFLSEKNFDLIIALVGDGELDAKDARMLIESEQMQNFLHSDKFNNLLPGGLTYKGIKSFVEEDIGQVISILSKGKEITAKDVKKLLESKPIQMFLHSDAFSKMLPGDLTYAKVKKLLQSDDATKMLFTVFKGEHLSADDARIIITSDIFKKFMISDQVMSMLPAGVSMKAVNDFTKSDEMKIIELLGKGKNFTVEDAKTLVGSKPVQDYLVSTRFQTMLPADITVDDLKSYLDEDMLKIVELSNTPGVKLKSHKMELIKDFDTIKEFLASHSYLKPLLKSPQDLNEDDVEELLESKEVQPIILQKTTKYFPENFDMEKLIKFKDSLLVQKLLPMLKKPEAATREDMMAVFESDAFKNAAVNGEKIFPDFSKGEISTLMEFMESSVYKKFYPLFEDFDAISTDDAVEMIKSGVTDIIIEHVVEFLPGDVSVDDVKELVSSGIAELVFSLVKDPKSFTVEDAHVILSSKPVQDAIYDALEKVLPKGMSIENVQSFVGSAAVKIFFPLLKDPSKVTTDDLKNFISTPETKTIFFDALSAILPKSLNVEDFQELMETEAVKKLMPLVQGDIGLNDYTGEDFMDLLTFEFEYCNTDDKSKCKAASIKNFLIEKAQDLLPDSVDPETLWEIFSSEEVQALLPLFKNPEDFRTEHLTNLLKNEDIRQALMNMVQEILPDGIDLSKAEEILSSKEVQEFLPLLQNPKDIRLDDFTKLLENDKIRTILLSQVETILPEGWSVARIEKILKSEAAQALLPLLKDPTDFGIDDLKAVMNDENIHKALEEQVQKIFPDLTIEMVNNFINSDTVQAILPLFKNPQDFSIDDLTQIISSDEVRGFIYDKIQHFLPEGWDLREVEKLLDNEAVKPFLSLINNPKDFKLDDVKALLMNEDVQDALLDQAIKLIDHFFGEAAEKSSLLGNHEKAPSLHLDGKHAALGEGEAAGIADFLKSGIVRSVIPLVSDPSNAGENAKKFFENKDVQKVLFSQVEGILPAGVTLETAEMIANSGPALSKLLTNPSSLTQSEVLQLWDLVSSMSVSESGNEVQQLLDAVAGGKKVKETRRKSGGDTDFSVAEAFGVGADSDEYEKTCKEKCDKEKGCDSTSTGHECSKCYRSCKGMANTVKVINTVVDNFENHLKPWLKNVGIDVDSWFSQEDMTPEKERAKPHHERWEPRSEYGLSSYDVSSAGLVGGANVFKSTEDSHSNGIFSRGMNLISESDMIAHSGLSFNPDFTKKEYAADFIDASMFGSQADFSFRGKNANDPKKDPMPSGKSQDIYLTFSGGGHVLEFTSSIEDRIDGMGYGWNFKADAEAKTDVWMEYEVMIMEGAMDQTTLYGKNAGIEHVMTWAKYGELSTTYSLGDSDPFDKFVVKVATDKRFGTPMFKTIGGASKCPAEPNTMWRESGIILTTQASAGMNNKFVSPQSSALFDVIITNETPYRENVDYGLIVVSGKQYTGDFGGNSLDLKFRINGEYVRPYGELLPLRNIESVDDKGNLKYTRLTLEIEKGRFGDEYTSIGLKLVSECESDIARNTALYRNPLASNDAFLGDFKWERECPKVDWDVTTYNRFLHYTASKNTGPYINMTLLNPDPLNLWSKDYKKGDTKKTNHLVHPHLEFIRIQWRNLGKGEWINAWEMVGEDENIWKNDIEDVDVHCESARGQGCSFKWNIERQYFLNGLKDGEYEIRAKAFCSGYDSFAPMEVKGSETMENLNLVVDVVEPFVTETSTVDHVMRIDYSEPILCPQLSVEHMTYEITLVETCAGDAVESGDVAIKDVYLDYRFVCMMEKGSLVVKFPQKAKGVYEITVNADEVGPKIMDAGGNTVQKQTFSTTIGCSNTGNSKSATRNGAKADMGKATAKRKENKHELNSSSLKTHKNTRAPSLGEAEVKVPASSPWVVSTTTIVLSIVIAMLSLYTFRLMRKLRDVEAKNSESEGDSMLHGVGSASEKMHRYSYGAIV